MNAELAVENCRIEAPFEPALKLIRGALAELELSVVGEIDFPAVPAYLAGAHEPRKALLVDCPLLLFEAMALDRSAAVFLPLHVLVCGAGAQTEAFVANPERWLNARLPAGAADPIARLTARIELALTAASDRAAAGSPRS